MIFLFFFSGKKSYDALITTDTHSYMLMNALVYMHFSRVMNLGLGDFFVF